MLNGSLGKGTKKAHGVVLERSGFLCESHAIGQGKECLQQRPPDGAEKWLVQQLRVPVALAEDLA